MNAQASLHWRVGALAVALLLAWRIVAVNTVLYGDDGRPRLGASAGEPALRAMLDDNPGEVAALLALGEEREGRGDIEGAARAYESALALGPVDRDTVALASGFFLRQGRIAQALPQLERLVQSFAAYDKVFPVFHQLLAARDPGMKAMLAHQPAWLGLFIADGCRRGADPLLLAPLLQRRVPGAQAAEAECVSSKLRAAGKWEAAYQAWLNTLPSARLADVGFVFNGGFEYDAAEGGFDWRTGQGSARELGNKVSFASTPGATGKRALRVTYSGKRQGGAAVEEYLAVPPGRYVLTGRARMEQLDSVKGVQWILSCAAEGARRNFAQSERFSGAGDWQSFRAEVVIPRDCPGQVLRLEPAGLHEGTTYVSGTAWFDDLRLAHVR